MKKTLGAKTVQVTLCLLTVDFKNFHFQLNQDKDVYKYDLFGLLELM